MANGADNGQILPTEATNLEIWYEGTRLAVVARGTRREAYGGVLESYSAWRLKAAAAHRGGP
ncbi:hypothetical protein ES319_A11G270100v1 [Gossypium barbadense]|uniref:Uncharacterized protein n=3 Tax=Gossypium TaxID=3633 RepID=A0A5J5TTF2_GOSBA|nr:hypothetical protein ES319_A11G270100v1 [Gossypium barbadense]TYG95777.1 hypothetical protein ES288_A11G295100v1 [Gossypium darwinii]TYI02786.1 hypothetical protein ES332_A11G291600v1 [Gossypium tomentosum]